MSSEGGGGGALRELLAVFGFGVDTKELEKGESKLGEFFESVKKVGEGVAAAFAVDQLYEFSEAQAHVITGAEHMAAQIGISVEEIQQWQYAAQASGFEADKFTLAMSRLQVAASNPQGAKSFAELGISVKDASGKAKEADQLFVDVAEAISKTEDPNKRAAIATRLFGRAGRELLPVFTEGAEGLDKLIEGFNKYGLAISEDDIAKTKAFEGAHADMGAAFKALSLVIARVLLPIFAKLQTWTAALVKGFVDLVQNSNVVQATLVLLGAAAAVFGAQLLIASAPILLVGALVAALVLAVDELITTFQGGDTVIRDAIDAAFGKGQTTELVKELKSDWDAVAESIKGAFEWVKQHTAELRKAAEIIGWVVKLPFRAAAAVGEEIGRENADMDRDADGGYAEYTGKGGGQSRSGGQVQSREDYYSPYASYAPTPTSSAGVSAMSQYQQSGANQSMAPQITVEAHVHNDLEKNEHVVRKIAHSVHSERNRAHADNLQRSGDQ